MGLSKEGRPRRIIRGIKTMLFFITMLISFLLFSLPVFLVITDAVVPSALLSASLSPQSLSLESLAAHLWNFDFRYSLIDIPLISLIRSAVILCVYSFCDGPSLSRGPYLAITTFCSVSPLVYVSLKASFVFTETGVDRNGYVRAMEMALFIFSLVLAIGHVVVVCSSIGYGNAYRTSCRERRKLLVYKVDIEAISACKNGFPRYQKIIVQEERMKQKVKKEDIFCT